MTAPSFGADSAALTAAAAISNLVGKAMKNFLPLFSWALVPIVAGSALAQTGDGYLGIYCDSLGTQACASVPPSTSTSLYVIAKTAGQSANGLTGAEFRLEVTSPSGWFIACKPPPASNAVLGNPIDTDPDPRVSNDQAYDRGPDYSPDGRQARFLHSMAAENPQTADLGHEL